MTVKRIVANVHSNDLEQSAFYTEVLGLELQIGQGSVRTYGSTKTMPVQVSIAQEDGSGTPAPDLSIEVDDVDAVLTTVKSRGLAIEYRAVTEPWGVKRA